MRNLERWSPMNQKNGPSELWGVIVEGTAHIPRWIITPTTKLDASDCQLICATHNAAIAQGEKSIFCESLVNIKGEPLVQITMGSETAQLDVVHARHHLGALYETIEAAMSDAVLVRFIREQVYMGQPEEKTGQATGQLLMMLRECRERWTGRGVIENLDDEPRAS